MIEAARYVVRVVEQPFFEVFDAVGEFAGHRLFGGFLKIISSCLALSGLDSVAGHDSKTDADWVECFLQDFQVLFVLVLAFSLLGTSQNVIAYDLVVFIPFLVDTDVRFFLRFDVFLEIKVLMELAVVLLLAPIGNNPLISCIELRLALQELSTALGDM